MHESQVHAESHPGPRQYLVIAAILTVITIGEIGVFLIESLNSAVMAGILLVLSGIKFAGVVAYYMHLRYDDRRYTLLFVAPFFMMVTIIIALMALFSNLTR